MKYAHISDSGQLIGWYCTEVHGENIPTPNVQVSDTAWQSALEGNHNKVNQDGTTEYYDFRTEIEKSEWESTQYQRDREVEYPRITDQLDMLYWDKVNGTNQWQQAITTVKATYPKDIQE